MVALSQYNYEMQPAATPHTKGMGSFMKMAAVVAAWYLSNTGVLLLNKFLLTNTGFRWVDELSL